MHSSMTLIQEPEAQRFVFNDVDWSFYQDVRARLRFRRAFVTYYKGKLEVVTTSFLRERISALLCRFVGVTCEETNTELVTAGRTTLEEQTLDEGVEADTSFYIANARRMKDKAEIDLAVDPPPDLAMEVEVTRRLGQRRLIYRDIGVPELWRYSPAGLIVLLRRGDDYVAVERSPTFPLLAPAELFELIQAGLAQDETQWVAEVRRRVRDRLPGGPPPAAAPPSGR